MGKQLHISEDIESCILEIEMNCPELYHYLEETPFKDTENTKRSLNEYQRYFNSLRTVLEDFQHRIYLNYQNKKVS